MRTMLIGCAALLLAAGPALAESLLQQGGTPSALQMMFERADRNGGKISPEEMQELRQKALEASRQRQAQLQQAKEARVARQRELVAVAPGLMTEALQRQCLDHVRSLMNDPSSLQVGAALTIDQGGSTGDIPEGRVQFATRIWGRNTYGASVAATLHCVYAVNGTAMTFAASGLYPPRTGILMGR